MKQLTVKLLSAFVLTATATSVYADSPASHTNEKMDTQLKTILHDYKNVLLSGDLSKTLDYVYPKVFDTIPKEQLKKLLFQTGADHTPKAEIISLKQTPVLPVKKYAKGTYTLVNYVMDIRMNMAQPGREKEMQKMLKNPKELADFHKFMKKMLSAMLNKDSTIEFEKNSFIANIHQKSSYIAINAENKGYKIVELTAPMAGRLEKILPKEIYNTYKSKIETLKAEAKKSMEALMSAE